MMHVAKLNAYGMLISFDLGQPPNVSFIGGQPPNPRDISAKKKQGERPCLNRF